MRLRKQGLDYYAHDVDMSADSKIQFVEAMHGLIGYAVVNKLYELIYRNGYWMSWTKKECILYAKRFGMTVEELESVVSTCLDEAIFDRETFERHSVLTSSGIQKRFTHATQKRKDAGKITTYNQSAEEMPINSAETVVNSAEMSINVDSGTQSIVKHSIEYTSDVHPTEDCPVDASDKTSERKAAEYMFGKIREHSPTLKQPNLDTWAKDFDKIFRIDERDKSTVRDVIDFATSDPFWQSNILSPRKLREKFDTLVIRMKNTKMGRNGKSPPGEIEDTVDNDPKFKQWQEMRKKASNGSD